MILARESGRLRVVAHSAHQRQVGLAGSAWGNEHFGAPAPAPLVIDAAAAHDAGWRAWDESPGLDPRTGQPFQFLDVATALVHGHSASVGEASDSHPYAGLLVSLHTCGVLADRFGWDREWPGVAGLAARVRRARGPRVALAFLLARQRFLAAQRRHRRALSERLATEADAASWLAPAEVWRSYDLLQVWDELSLHFATGGTGERTIGPPPARSGTPATLPAFTLRSVGPRAATLSPYPFGAARVELPLEAAYVDDRSYAGTDEFVAALRAAAAETLVFTVAPG
ncbi:MAG: hypothetical protein QOH58_265 [Thermoleophilaceae bacterium]|nr:hypothetical protein [Thermoleophilaceae bacterium]